MPMAYEPPSLDGFPSLRALRSFVTLAEELHFSRSAARLGIAQPSLSRQVKVLEEAVGARLFRRTKREVKLSDAGHALLPDARLMLAHAARTLSRVRSIAAGEAGTLRVGFVASGAYDILPSIVRGFRRACPDAGIEIDECSLRLPLEQLETGALDLAIVRGPVTHPTLRTEPLLRENLCAVLPRTHRLAGTSRLAVSHLAAETFALFPRHRSPAFHDAITGYCRNAGFEPRIAHEAADWQVLVSMVAAGMAITLAPASVRRLPRTGVVYRALEPAAKIAQLDLVYGASAPSSLALSFARVARERARAG